MPTPRLDRRFSDPHAEPTPWAEVTDVVDLAELYWLSTIRADGRPHVTPLIGVWHDGAMHFTTGPREQKHRNLEHSPKVALTTGTNTWAVGLDVVVEGAAVRVTDKAELQRIADAIEGEVRQRLALRRRRRDVRRRRRRARGRGVPDRGGEGHGVREGPARAHATSRVDGA